MPATTANQIPVVAVGETRNAKVSFARVLDDGELLTGTPTVVEVTSADLTIDNKAINSSAVTMFGESVAAGKVVTFRFSGQLTKTIYTIKVTVSTDVTPAQTLVRLVKFKVD